MQNRRPLNAPTRQLAAHLFVLCVSCLYVLLLYCSYVGEVTRVDPTLLNSLVNSGYIPVVATVATDETGQALNVNADTAAGEVRVGTFECAC